MDFSRKFKNRKEKQHYIDICTTIWGCVPVDVDWAIQTLLYQNANTPKL